MMPSNSSPRLIEVTFPLKQASLDSVHEKNVRHGHISTLHIWPARRPLAACRAALITTLLLDPGTPEERRKILEKLGGKVVEKIERKKMPSGKVVERIKEETVGGILHWGREQSSDLEWFREEIRKAYGGRAPKVLDPFAGGGAIPLEAMRLGCEVTATDINPVAWFILKCTLEYPQKLAGHHHPLPRFALESPEFMEGFFKGTGKLTKKQLERNLQGVQMSLFSPPDLDLACHVRAWGWWVLQKAKADLEPFYPMVHKALKPDGHPVIVFAHKQPDAWETLVSAVIRAGFVVDGSWPIQTERGARARAHASAALSSSVWLVCKKRPEAARSGWDNRVLKEMREKITMRLREFWDAGIRGPDFVWAATGPALEAYSKHPVVKKANEPGKVMAVSEFLRHVRRIVVDFVVGRVLSRNGGTEAVSSLDDVTTYYLLHRHDFGMEDAPIGACILYAISCGLSDGVLANQYDILIRTGGQETPDEDEESTSEDTDAGPEEGTGSRVKLRPWHQRSKRKRMGYEAPSGRPVPLIDQIHRLMHLWKAGDVVKVDDYLDSKGLRRNQLFHQLLQALIELAGRATEERSLLESISNHVAVRGARFDTGHREMFELASHLEREDLE